MSTLTLSRVMMPWDWMGMVTMRIEIRHRRSMTGMMIRNPGSRTPITRPRRKCTPRWYCWTTLIDARASNTATMTPETVRSAAIWFMTTTSIGVGNARRAQHDLLLTLEPRRLGGQRPKVPTPATEGPLLCVTTPPGSPRRACAPGRRTRRPDPGRERWAAPG